MPEYLSFALPDDFIAQYDDREIPWGFPIGGGNSLGELTYLTKYSRRKPDGTKERWPETCRRVIEGMYSILKDHCAINRTPWNEAKALRSAKDAYERMFVFKWLPPGRGLWMMGTEFVHKQRNSAPLQNCAFLSTKKMSAHSVKETIYPFVRLMEMSMLGIGVGFDTLGADKIRICQPKDEETRVYEIPDTREGWYESVGFLLESYFFQGRPTLTFDYGLIRKKGEPIRGFGGVAAGPQPLIDLHESIRKQFEGRADQLVSSSDIVDLQNKIGKCVVAGNVRRSAELAIGSLEDEAFLDLKDFKKNPVRMGKNGWGYTSNNAVWTEIGKDLTPVFDRVNIEGEIPGILYLDLMRSHGRLCDPPNYRDYRAAGANPCVEQTLEPNECCTLVENFPFRAVSLQDFLETLKVSYLYGKAVTLLPTHWPETNEVMQRNRRIGCSISGLAQFVEAHGWNTMKTWMLAGYDLIQERDRVYSEWLGIRESLKTTSIKPSGTVSLLVGATPGGHWPTAAMYIRRMRLATNDPILIELERAGYKTEPDVMDPVHSVCVELPTLGAEVRSEQEVSVWEKAALAKLAQRYWADNQVSVTLTYRPEEQAQIEPLIRSTEGDLKCLSFLPILDVGARFVQMPYEAKTREEIEALQATVQKINWMALYRGGQVADAQGELYCSNDVCEIKIA